MKIPKQIQQFAQTITTVYQDNLLDEDNATGLACYRQNEIRLQAIGLTSHKYTKKNQEQWYCHELVHHILDGMGEHKLRKDEKFVDLFGNLLHQALTSAKY